MSHKNHPTIFQEEDVDIRIPLRLDGIFSYFPTLSITPEDIENFNHVEAIFLTPDLTSWDSYDDTYEEEEENFLIKKEI